MLNTHDLEILRPLLMQYAEIAALPIHNEKRKLWLDNNEHRDARPMVLIDQVCWNEFNIDGCLDCFCEDPYWRGVEWDLREKLYRWKHFPVDLVYNPYLNVPKPIIWHGWGLDAQKDLIRQGETSGVYSQRFHNVLDTEEDIEKLQDPVVSMDYARLEEIRQEADRLCEGIIPYRLQGGIMHLGIWDFISEHMGVEDCYINIMDRPEFIHALMERLTQGLLAQIDSFNKIGGYDVTGNITHCSHTFSDDLPKKDCDPEFGTTDNGWAFGLAQLFSSASPDVTDEFEVPYMNRIFPHFGAVYYGCCERLDDRMHVLKKLKNIRKLSCSPWSHKEHFAEEMPDWCVMSAKPNPALLATNPFDEDLIRKDLRETIDAARRNHRNLELLQKDITTVNFEPQRLWRWAEIAMEEVQR